jgi:hypothetical protein
VQPIDWSEADELAAQPATQAGSGDIVRH